MDEIKQTNEKFILEQREDKNSYKFHFKSFKEK